jgi:hypothetical protein
MFVGLPYTPTIYSTCTLSVLLILKAFVYQDFSTAISNYYSCSHNREYFRVCHMVRIPMWIFCKIYTCVSLLLECHFEWHFSFKNKVSYKGPIRFISWVEYIYRQSDSSGFIHFKALIFPHWIPSFFSQFRRYHTCLKSTTEKLLLWNFEYFIKRRNIYSVIFRFSFIFMFLDWIRSKE